MTRTRRTLPAAALLLFSLLFAAGFAPGPQTDEGEAREKASFVPKFSEYYSKPTVETSAFYSSASDTWTVSLSEDVSGKFIGEMTVDDDSGRVSRADLDPDADNVTYPNLSRDEAVKLAEADGEVREELASHGSYTSGADYAAGEWKVRFYVDEPGAVGGRPTPQGKEVAQVGVDDEEWTLTYVYTGDGVGWQMARGERGAYGKQANYWYVWGPLALAFVVAFFRFDRLFSLRNLDVLALLGFLVSHGFFRAGEVHEAVLLWYPPLLYLLGRTLLMGFGVGEKVERTTNLPTWLLLVLAGLASGLVLGLNTDARVIDVGYAGVVGADLILNGSIPYGNMPEDVATGDTYGPLNYLLYVPFVLIFGFSGVWDFLPAAHALTSLSFAAGAAALFVAGFRLSGPKAGAALVFAWAAFPYTLYSANNNTNDIVVAAVSAVALAAATGPIGRGAGVAAGFAVKLYPLILGPLWLLKDGFRRRPIVDFFLGGAAILLLTFWVLLIDGHPFEAIKIFYGKTVAFQGDRETPWTIFTQLPALAFLQKPLTVFAAALAVLVAFVPRTKTVRRLAALSAALVIAFELTVNYWFYPYVTWFEPFVFVSLLLATNEKTPLDGKQPVPGEGLRETEEDPGGGKEVAGGRG